MNQIQLSFTRDKTNFPMVWVEAVGAYVHWLPVTKVQFETFMCASPDPRFDERWYDTILELNRRVSPNRINDRNFWNAFVTGIQPDEIRRFIDWCGDGYSLPHESERITIYQELKGLSPYDVSEFDHMPDLSERARTLIKKLDAASKRALSSQVANRNLAEQMFLKYGPLEWVDAPSNTRSPWAGAGEPLRSFAPVMNSVDLNNLNYPINPNQTRIDYYGFRLLRRFE